MGLKKIASALLPRDRRDQILGDLHERGFRLGDVASVLPRVWWSHIHRACTPPRFAIAGALQDRLAQFSHRALVSACIIGGCIGVLCGGGYREFSVRRCSAVLLGIALGYLVSLHQQRAVIRKALASREGWLAYYRDQLASHYKYLRLGGLQPILLITLIQIAQEIWPALNTRHLEYRALYLSAVYLLAVTFNHPRANRIRREIQGLP